mmetsp:Transcript_38605/g.69101  ORF Transcript_38605/g.69101 Transcript_38605/m.69101 type:complete len:139 (-) Transcript_38605:66-482(-)
MLFGVVASSCVGGRTGTHTTMVSGHILTLGGLVANFSFNQYLSPEERGKMMLSFLVIAGTIAGAMFGAWAVANCNEHILLFPVPVALVILLFLHDHLAKPRSFIKKVQNHLRAHSPSNSQDEANTSESESVDEKSDTM